jgi:DNA-binding transcriptional MerR regulator
VYTVKQLSDLTDISVRTLHYYDEIDLLRPTSVGANGYRYYDDAALLRLQQILFYREIGLELAHIKEILDRPDFDLVSALRSHREALHEKIKRLENLVGTVDATIMHIAGGMEMSKKRMFEPFSEEKQQHYERVARLQYDPHTVNESIKRWNSYTKEKQAEIFAESGQIYSDIADALEKGLAPESEEVQAMIDRWQENMRYFYEPTLDIMRGLAGGYSSDPDFIAFFHKLHPDLPDYLTAAILQYVDDLETAEIERMLAEDRTKRVGE